MFEKRIDSLALYAGLDLTHPVAGLRVPPTIQAISQIFKRTEHIANVLNPQENKRTTHSNLESNDQLSKKGRHT